MKLPSKEFKRLKELEAKLKKEGKLSEAEKAELSELLAKRGGGNDVRWWTKYKLYNDAANFPFNTIKGIHVPLDSPGSAPNYGTYPKMNYVTVNGMRIEYFRGSGYLESAEDSLNYQMRMLWLDMHRKYRGMGGYEWADLGIIIRSIVEAFADIARAERVYGSLNYYNARNRSVPLQLMQALEFDETQAVGDTLADFRYQINRILLKAKSLCLPKGLGILQSFLELDSNIFKDSDSERAIWYLYDTPLYACYEAASLPSGGSIQYRTRTRTSYGKQSFSDIIADLEQQFSRLLSDTDVARVCSDVIAAYGSENVVTLTDIPENYTVIPIRDDNRLMQLHNTIIVPLGGDRLGATSKQNLDNISDPTVLKYLTMFQENGIIKQPLFAGNYSTTSYYMRDWRPDGEPDLIPAGLPGQLLDISVGDVLIDFWKDEVSVDDKMEMTRQTVGVDPMYFVDNDGDNVHAYRLIYGNIICTRVALFYTDSAGMSSPVIYADKDVINFGANANDNEFIIALSQVDWHPKFVVYYGANPPIDTGNRCQILFDIDNYVALGLTTLQRMHDVAMLSAFKFDSVTVADQADK